MERGYAKLDYFSGETTQIGETVETCRLRKWQRVLLVFAVVALLLIIVGLIVGLLIKLLSNESATPTLNCPVTPPSNYIHCSPLPTGENLSQNCENLGCCLYNNTLCIYETNCYLEHNEKFTCLPEGDDWDEMEAKSTCISRGCCWNPDGYIRCFYPQNYGYIMSNKQDTSTGITADLARRQQFPSMYGNEVNKLKLEVTYETSYRLRVKIYDPTVSRYEVPLSLTSTVQPPLEKPSTVNYGVDLHEEPFGFQIERLLPTKKTLFKTAPGLVFSSQFIQLSSYLPSKYIYGLGEHATPWKLNMNFSRLTLFARDIPPDPVYDTTRNLYGVHPMYLCMEDDGNAHGVFFINSNAMEIELSLYPSITYRTIGGILDFYYFIGPTPADVVAQYTELIGRPFMPPYWSLGFHLCRWGYYSANRTLEVVKRMREYGIPQDTQWNDIDYMSHHLDFTYNHTTYDTLPELVDNLHQNGQHYIVITDPGIKFDANFTSEVMYPPYKEGIDKGVFILNSTKEPILGRVWPGITVYPDFTNPSTEQYWLNQIDSFHKNISFDGLWIDMNEPSNFVPGSIYNCTNSSLNEPPFLPTAIRNEGNIFDKTICMTSLQNLSLHYNVHSLYGHTEAIHTMNALATLLNKRTIVISRSTFPGSGKYCGHWLGDNASQWPHLRQSIPGILNFALFGIPLVGADICGFFDNTTTELCTRWQQLGAFYPFSRNHNTYNATAQDPTEFDEYSISSTRDALLTRYKLLPFLYTLFYYAHTNGSMVARPLLSVFPDDKETWANGNQFMWGDALLISPVLYESTTEVNAYFPSGRWFDFRNGTEIVSVGEYINLYAPMNYIPLHVLGGKILPQQMPSTTTTLSRLNPYSLLIALDSKGVAYGSVFIDDGEEIDSISKGHYTLVTFQAKPHIVYSVVVANGYTNNMLLESIVIYGLAHTPSTVVLNDNSVSSWTWDMLMQVFQINVNITMDKPFSLTWK